MSFRESGGYKGQTAQLLAAAGAKVGDKVTIVEQDARLEGILMPRYESAAGDYVVIKLRSGYNAGVEVAKIKSIIRQDTEDSQQHAPSVQRGETRSGFVSNELPKISLLSTGGTIASKVDYRTGAVRPALSAQELYESVPELDKVAQIEPTVLFSEYSENLTPAHWTGIAGAVTEKVRAGSFAGIVIAHGTDTMHYTASALSFALRGVPIPVVLVGAQRSSDRPSSDAALNLQGAATFAAKSKTPGVFVAMHADLSDQVIACHMGTRVRKNHTSRRDAFESIDAEPVALVRGTEITVSGEWRARFDSQFRISNVFVANPRFDPRVSLLKYYPGFEPSIIENLVAAGHRALILEGTGLGHVSRSTFESIRRAIAGGVAVFMTSQCIWGRVRMTVYDTGRDLLEIGVIPLSDMISETALTKAMWALANSSSQDEFKEAMTQNLAFEMSDTIEI
ncbi:MAG: Glu-tRNA(Gln) amidotransferase subunit GatD [Nitrososphaera sp.]